jgi:hypothetical protein
MANKPAMEQVQQATEIIQDVAGALGGVQPGAASASSPVVKTTPSAHEKPQAGTRGLPTKSERAVIDALWFWARLTFLFAVAPLVFVDVTLMLVGLGLMIIPLPYLVIVGRMLVPVIFGKSTSDAIGLWFTRPMDAGTKMLQGGGATVLMVLAGIVVGLVIYFWHRSQADRYVEFVQPDPQQQWVRLMGKEHPFEIEDGILRVAGLRLELKRAEPDADNPWHWRFATGTEVEFVPKNSEATRD